MGGKSLLWLPLTVVVAVVLTACGGSSGPATVVETASATVNGTSTTILADAAGMTLYYLKSDTPSQITCSGACATTWPPLLAPSGTASGSGLSGTVSVLNGPNGNQVLYNGHPLYHFSGDKAPGDTNGEGIGNKWFVATATLAQASASAKPGY